MGRRNPFLLFSLLICNSLNVDRLCFCLDNLEQPYMHLFFRSSLFSFTNKRKFPFIIEKMKLAAAVLTLALTFSACCAKSYNWTTIATDVATAATGIAFINSTFGYLPGGKPNCCPSGNIRKKDADLLYTSRLHYACRREWTRCRNSYIAEWW